MRITLTVIAGPHQGQVYSFSGHDTFLVGRSRRAHFRLPEKDRYFSRIHFLVEVNPPCCRLMDMGSRNGTYVNGQKVEMADLKDSDQIRAGRTILQVKVEADNGVPSALPAPPPLPAPATQGIGPPPSLGMSIPGITLPPSAPVVTIPPGGILPPVLVEPEPLPIPEEANVPSARSRSPVGRCRVCEAILPPATVSNSSPLQSICFECQHQIRSQEQFVEGYHLVRSLGQGAMGIVYLALRKLDARLVALKTIIPAVAGSATQVERFLREVEILRSLNHPNIVAFRETGESNGRLFFAMDFIKGADAHRLVRTQGPMQIPRAIRLAGQLLDALAYAHDRGFVHRDIKPSNMLVTEIDGLEMVKLADFGLARVYQASQLSGLTVTGDFGGTVAFMAPEQITEYREARPPVDQYAAAATLYNLLTGQYVYDLPSDLAKQLYLVLHESHVPIRSRRSDIPRALGEVIHRALSRDPLDRFPDVRAFQAALLPFSV